MVSAYLALTATIAAISWSAIFVRWADVPGPVSAFYRVLIAAAVLVPWRLARGATRRPQSRAAVWTAVAGGVFFALDLALWNTAVMTTQAAVASILGNNTPIFVALMSWAAFRKRPRAAFWIGLALSMTGCLLILGARVQDGLIRSSLTGNLLALGASFFFAAYLVATQRVRATMDTLTFNTLAILGSVAALLLICVAVDMPLGGITPRGWLALAGLGLVTQLAAYYLLVYALGHLPATITSVGLLAQVPCTAMLAWLFLGEPLTAPQIVGGAIVLAGIYVVNRQRRESETVAYSDARAGYPVKTRPEP